MKHGEEGYIAELLLSDETKMERSCTTVAQVIKKGIFSIEKALELYNVPMQVYFQYLNNEALNKTKDAFSGKHKTSR